MAKMKPLQPTGQVPLYIVLNLMCEKVPEKQVLALLF
jgi:hypothetical protein